MYHAPDDGIDDLGLVASIAFLLFWCGVGIFLVILSLTGVL